MLIGKAESGRVIGPEECIEYMSDLVASDLCDHDEDGSELAMCAFIVKTLEKQIPTFPKSWDPEKDSFVCPNCKKEIYADSKGFVQDHSYCLNCGQRLRWY